MGLCNFFSNLPSRRAVYALLLCLAFSSTVLASDSAKKNAQQHCFSVSDKACDIAHNLGKGINLGNMLEAPNEGQWGIRLDPAYIELLKGKFKTVRIPVRWSNHASSGADATIDDFFLKRVSKAVDHLLSNGHYVILNVHHYNQINGKRLHKNEFKVDESVLDERLINIWKQLAKHFKTRSENLIFEILNEPTGRLTHAKWNVLQAQVVREIRDIEPQRVLMVTPRFYRPIHQLAKLDLPKDLNLIVALHQYTPFSFTHQGIKYLPMKLPVGVRCCGVNQKNEVLRELEMVTDWNKVNGVPVHFGEFGSYKAADMPSRVHYTQLMVDELEQRGIGWTYWEFGSHFGVYDTKAKRWRWPLLEALLH